MPKRMLIDASHPEETRVVVLDGSKVEEFDFEAASKRPLKGNIYLAKVTRVEPSLQAAFVEYGGNRQGFLAFSEIHPDYYQIPVADRMALLADQSRRLLAEDEDVDAVATAKAPAQDAKVDHEDAAHEDEDHEDGSEAPTDNEEVDHEASGETSSEGESEDGQADGEADEAEHAAHDGVHDDEGGEDSEPAEHAVEAEATGAPAPRQRRSARQRAPRRRQYKIQEVIKRRQVMLVQVVKEERGNKGASLTTYLSLAGRYCVLMPNTPRGGGISRKITSATDRRRLKSAAQSLELPEGMGLIIRTAGANRTKAEIKRDYEYLLRLWDSVRELTLQSNAPALVYEEGNLVKRAIRDLYNKDISEILVDGETGYRDAKDFMRMLMPSHAKNVKLYKEALPLFQRHPVEAQLDAMFSPTVTLKSGGYLVINQTEALVAIDVNSGRATREHSIEETAHKTNLEAADEIGRQVRLRDLAGLIVIDFIDMEETKNDRAVEKRLREAVRGDRARVQIGKISQFGLLEMSRQRLRAGVLAGSTVTCPHCAGVGLVRSTESAALRLLRALDEEGQRQPASDFLVRTPEDIVVYTLNHKRREIARIEDAYDLSIQFEPRDGMPGGSFEIERTGARVATAQTKKGAAVSFDAGFKGEPAEPEEDVTIVEAPAPEHHEADAEAGGEEGHNGKRRRRRRRRGGRGRGQSEAEPSAVADGDGQAPAVAAESAAPAEGDAETGTGDEAIQAEDGGEKRRRRRRRGRRGRRRDADTAEAPQEEEATDAISASGESHSEPEQAPIPAFSGSESAEEEADLAAADFGIAPNAPSSPQWTLAGEQTVPNMDGADAGSGNRASARDEPEDERPADAGAETAAKTGHEDAETGAEPAGPARKGWWQRRFKM